VKSRATGCKAPQAVRRAADEAQCPERREREEPKASRAEDMSPVERRFRSAPFPIRTRRVRARRTRCARRPCASTTPARSVADCAAVLAARSRTAALFDTQRSVTDSRDKRGRLSRSPPLLPGDGAPSLSTRLAPSKTARASHSPESTSSNRSTHEILGVHNGTDTSSSTPHA
jgi:hypothetical protein